MKDFWANWAKKYRPIARSVFLDATENRGIYMSLPRKVAQFAQFLVKCWKSTNSVPNFLPNCCPICPKTCPERLSKLRKRKVSFRRVAKTRSEIFRSGQVGRPVLGNHWRVEGIKKRHQFPGGAMFAQLFVRLPPGWGSVSEVWEGVWAGELLRIPVLHCLPDCHLNGRRHQGFIEGFFKQEPPFWRF